MSDFPLQRWCPDSRNALALLGCSQSETIAASGECSKATTFLLPRTDCARDSE